MQHQVAVAQTLRMVALLGLALRQVAQCVIVQMEAVAHLLPHLHAALHLHAAHTVRLRVVAHHEVLQQGAVREALHLADHTEVVQLLEVHHRAEVTIAAHQGAHLQVGVTTVARVPAPALLQVVLLAVPHQAAVPEALLEAVSRQVIAAHQLEILLHQAEAIIAAQVQGVRHLRQALVAHQVGVTTAAHQVGAVLMEEAHIAEEALEVVEVIVEAEAHAQAVAVGKMNA